jgi:diguanylate cyclase (GGDEF)-like protein/PAS domain S-box-containing protein
MAVYGVLWFGLILVYFRFPATHPFLYGAIGLVGATAVLHGVRLHRPSARLPWLLVAAALVTFVLGDSTYNVLTAGLGQDNPFPSIADVFYLLTYPAFAGALVVFNRRAASHRSGAVLLDSLIICVGIGILVWVYWIGSYVAADGLGFLERAVSIAYPLGDVLLLVMLARLLLSVHPRPVALTLLTAGAVSLLAADVLYGFVQLNGAWSNGAPIDALWFACYGFWGAAALHPSMRDMTTRQFADRSELRWSRLFLIAAASLIAPVVLLERSLASRTLETGVIAVFSALLFALVLTRLAGVVRQQRRSVERERALRQVSGDLASATTRTSIKTVVERTLPSIADKTMVSWLVLREEFGAASHEEGQFVDAYGTVPRGRVMFSSRQPPGTRQAEALHVLVVPVSTGDGADLLGLICVRGRQVALASVGDAVQTLTSQVVLALVRVTLDNELVSRRSEEHFRALIQNATDVIIVLDDGDHVSYATPSVQGMLGEGPETVVGKPLFDLLHVDSRRQAGTALSRLRERGRGAQDLDDWQVVAYDGRSVEVEVFLADLRDVDVVDGVVLTMRDVTMRRQLERELIHRASHDPLTGLANRVLFNDRTEEAVRRAGRSGSLAAVLFCDLDEFKDVNDVLGHVVGDQLLQAVAERVSHVVRPADTAARLGGDEFAVLAEDLASIEEVKALGDRLVKCLGEPFDVKGESITVSASVGICTSSDADSSTELLRAADLAMYAAKDAGKQTWRMFVPEMRAAVSARIALRADIEAALADGSFRLAYQPLVTMANGRAVGVEALVRWHHPRRGLLMPEDFLSVAEETGLIVPLGAWVLRTAVREAQGWRLHDGTRPQLNVNVSARQLQVPGFPDVVRQALADADFPAEALVLELTESLFLDDDEQSNGAIAELKRLGVRLAMDDFGTGYSSLGYLRNFPVDVLKIDKAFIRDLALPSQRALVDAIVRIALVLGLDLVAEGVEELYQRDILLDLGCDIGQGYHYAKPVAPSDIPRLLAHLLPLAHAQAAKELQAQQ